MFREEMNVQSTHLSSMSSPAKYATSSGIVARFSFSLLCTAAFRLVSSVPRTIKIKEEQARTDKDGELGFGEVGLLVLGELVKLSLDVLLELSDGVAEGRARVVDLVL